MAGYNDPEGGYVQNAPGAFAHLGHVTDITNKFDKDDVPVDGYVWTYEAANGLYHPRPVPGGGAGGLPTPYDYGGVGNDVADDTTPLNNWLADLASSHTEGYLPRATWKTTAKLNIPSNYGWKVHGAGPAASIIKQYTDNTPIIDIGTTGSGTTVHSWEISDIGLTYANVQSSAQTSAWCLRFSQPGFEGRLERINFLRGYRGIGVNAGIVGMWGVTHADLNFGSEMTGQAISMAGMATAGTPNNYYERIFVTAANMVGPVFYLRASNAVMDAIEIIQANQGAQLLYLVAGSNLVLHQLKCEVGAYAASQELVYLETNSTLHAGIIRVSTLTISGAAVVKLLKLQGGSGYMQRASVDLLEASAQFDGTSRGFLTETFGSGPATTQIDVGTVNMEKTGGSSANGWQLQDCANSPTADMLAVRAYQSGKASANLPDANYTAALNGPHILVAKTAFTAPRTFTLPGVVNDIPGSMTYQIITQGAVNGANTLIVQANGATLHTITADNMAYEYTYRRASASLAQNNWQLTAKMSLA